MSNVVVFPTIAPPPPDYTHHQGRTIVWEPWTMAIQATCLRPSECERCGSADTPLFASARAQPFPGETFTATEPRRVGHQEGMAVKEVEVPAWPVWRLCAFRCPRCGHVDVLDMERDYELVDVDIAQLTLF